MRDMTYADAIAKAPLLVELGETTIWLSRDEDDAKLPWDKVKGVREGSTWRLSGPSSCWIVAEDAGLTFKWSVDFEGRDANGRGVSLFDRDRLRELMLKLPPAAREEFAAMLAEKVLPPLAIRTTEIRNAWRDQADSEDCVRGLIAFARQKSPEVSA